MIRQAYQLLASFGFVGMAMVEFKGDCLLEVNPRVWGSFPMTEAAQSPLVAHYARAAAGERVAYAAQDYRTGVRMRFLLNDTLAALHYLRAGRIGVFLRSIADLFTAKEALRCRGDSMQPRLLDGDIVMIRQQPDVLDGQIAAVLIGSEATLKHVYHLPQNAGLRLMPENPAYDPIFVTPENADTVRVLGRAVGYQRLLTKG